MRKRTWPIVIRFHDISKLKSPGKYYLRLLQLQMSSRDKSYQKKHIEVTDKNIDKNLRRHEPFIAIDYDEFMNFPDILMNPLVRMKVMILICSIQI